MRFCQNLRVGWEEFDDRLVSCLIMDPAGKTTGSLKDSGI